MLYIVTKERIDIVDVKNISLSLIIFYAYYAYKIKFKNKSVLN